MSVLSESHVLGLMEKNGSYSTMNVLVWGVLLLGGIGVFIVWGLANAYPVIK